MGGYDPYGYGNPTPPPPPPPPPPTVTPTAPPPTAAPPATPPAMPPATPPATPPASTSNPAPATPTGFFDITSLVTDDNAFLTRAGLPAAAVVDPHLINPWGVAFTADEPFWISDNGTGLTTIYAPNGQLLSPIVTIPAPAGAPAGTLSTPTGQVANIGTSADFRITSGGRTQAAQFIFVTEDGTISGWNPNVDINHAITVVDQSAQGAVYKGVAIGQTGGSTFLYAADLSKGTVDVFDHNFAAVKSFTDPNLPAGYAPFNVQVLNGKLYVAFALQDATKQGDQPGLGHGFVDQFDLAGNLVQRVASQGMLNSPWGLEIAPSTFGKFAGALLVGNFGDGHVLAYDPNSGAFLGSLSDPAANPLVLGDLWALTTSNTAGANPNAVYFTAGVQNEAHGLFGTLTASTAVMAASSAPGSTFMGTSAADQLTGTAGNDIFVLLGGNDTVVGNGGHDTVVLTGNRSDWTLALTNVNGHESGTLTGPGGVKLVDNIEEIQFADGRLVFDDASLDPNMAPIAYRLYTAALNRLPDQGGLEVQAHALQAGITPLQLANNFYNSSEFQMRYGTPTDTQYATLLYQNVLGRAPDAGGLAVQVNALGTGLARDQLLLNFSESAENVARSHVNTDFGFLLT